MPHRRGLPWPVLDSLGHGGIEHRDYAVPAAKPQVIICMTMTNTEDMGLQSQAKSVASVILPTSGRLNDFLERGIVPEDLKRSGSI
jgi:hypothetical protein